MATFMAAIAILAGSSPAVAASEPKEGERIGKIRIPAIGLKSGIYEGDSSFTNPNVLPWSLRKGPAHYPGLPFPWEPGTSAFAGHRTTWTKPFARLDELKRGNRIIMKMRGHGNLRYKVVRKKFVPWNDTSDLEDHGKNRRRLVLTACHPPGSASQRIVIIAKPLRKKAKKDKPPEQEAPAPPG